MVNHWSESLLIKYCVDSQILKYAALPAAVVGLGSFRIYSMNEKNNEEQETLEWTGAFYSASINLSMLLQFSGNKWICNPEPHHNCHHVTECIKKSTEEEKFSHTRKSHSHMSICIQQSGIEASKQPTYTLKNAGLF